ncbi:FeoA family protein [Desulforamulus ruminis]
MGSTVTVISIGRDKSPTIIGFDGKQIQISYKAASQIYVDQASRP